MVKKIVFSAQLDHEVIKKVVAKLKQIDEFELIIHDPTKEFFCLSEMVDSFTKADLIIVKVRNECSIDLLHFAKLYNLPTLHNIDTISICKNKIALDYALRKTINTYKEDLEDILLPNSWNQSLSDINKFKKWALNKLPIVIKSHYQHDKYNRFNFLVQKIEEVDIFCERYKNFLYYDVYIQEFIECDGMEYKIYVVGDKVYGIIRENPIYLFLREKPVFIDVDKLERNKFKVDDKIKLLAEKLSESLNLKLFGFDLIKSKNQDQWYIIDLNDFPSYKGIRNIESSIVNFLRNYILNL